MFGIVIAAIKFIILLGFLVLIHEGGHFLVAKLCKVRVHEFAIGFGPYIWKKKKGDTLYALRAVPLGGFVRMEGEEERSDQQDSFSQKSIPQRIAILLAGGTVNIIFGLVVYFILATAGGNYVSNQIEQGTEEASLQAGDKIIAIDHKKIHLKSDLEEALKNSNGNSVEVQIERNGQKETVKVTPKQQQTKNTGIYFGATGDHLNTEIRGVYPNSPASAAGLKEKDVILKVNGQEVHDDPYAVIDLTQNTTAENVQYTIHRNGQEMEISVKPETVVKYYLGVSLKKADNTLGNNLYYGFWDTANFSVSILDNLKTLLTGHVSVDQLMGPIGISTMVADTNGFAEFIYVLALISLALGVTNLLPIPPLDGWKVVVYLVEAIRRKPMREEVQMQIESWGFIFMIVLSLYVAYHDVLRIF